MKLNNFIAIASIMSLAFAASCQKEKVKEAQSIVLDQTSVTVYVGQTATVTPSFTPDNADPDMVWTSSDESIATVNGGYVCGVAPGNVTITVVATGNVTSSFPVTVKEVLPTKFVLDKKELTLFEEGAGATLKTTIEPYNTTYKDVVWASSDTSVVKVDSLGNLTQKALGKATVTATLHGDRAVANCAVEVRVEIKDKADTTVCWKTNKAWHKSIFGAAEDNGKKSEKGCLTYNHEQGMVEWTENTTGMPRTDSILLSTGAKFVITQLDENDFNDTWTFKAKFFTNNPNVVAKAGNNQTKSVTFGEPLGGVEELEDFDGITHTNNIGITGLYGTAVMNACVEIDYEEKLVKLGIFFDARKAQKVTVSNVKDYGYVCFLPEMGTSPSPTANWTSPWNFVQPILDETKNYCWLWFTLSSDLSSFTWNSFKEKQFMTGSFATDANCIIGITCAVCKSNVISTANIYSTYNIIYQANTNYDTVVPMSFKRNN